MVCTCMYHLENHQYIQIGPILSRYTGFQMMRGAHPSTFATGQIYRQGNRWLLAVSYSMGTPACCMMLFGVRLMGSNVLKYTRHLLVVC